ncbi:TrkH family potassium uptake protein [Dethiosulfovibrio salsuginis]|uniref:Trk system potassium uptake protein TrkH n=1 Tax=Dethiosulfovibrio salsuginis TaxID=561720 RepID=A0A1X7JEY2_9BACT|nr:potassium transporter TrkG [Dethiosulfovibrio salsuginis]SMG26549.1 trk system potassium uptake protein TrkH [Dethiosulfovibrio salsuginis]
MRLRLVLRVLGLLVGIVSLSMIWPLYWSLSDGTADWGAFVVSILAGLSIGAAMFALGKGEDYQELGIREAFAVVSLSWVVASAVGALPFYLSQSVPTYTDGFFEAMSGFSTTGASILTDIESNPRGILFWRSLTHWLGGMGIIVLSLAILPFIGVGGMQLFKAEVPGPTPEKLTPRVQQTAVLLWAVYVLLSALEVGALALGGMNMFESLTHTFGTMATGGFSPLNGSIGQYDSAYFDWVITLFMFLAGANFALHYMVLRGKWGSWWNDEEFRFYLKVVLFSTFSVALSLYLSGQVSTFERSLRDGAFQVVSILTTTGYATADFDRWPFYGKMVLFLLMFLGGCAGSTGGGIKNVRIMVLIKRVGMEISHLLHPQQIIRLRLNGRVLKEDVLASVTAFFIIYVLLFAGFSLAMAATGLDLIEAFSSVAATLGNIGPGFGQIGPTGNYSAISITGKWILSLCMLLGRLEIFTVVMLFVPGTWRQ